MWRDRAIPASAWNAAALASLQQAGQSDPDHHDQAPAEQHQQQHHPQTGRIGRDFDGDRAKFGPCQLRLSRIRWLLRWQMVDGRTLLDRVMFDYFTPNCSRRR